MKLILAIILLIGFIPPTHAKVGDWLINEMFDEDYIYQATKGSCEQIEPRDLYRGKSANLYAGKFPEFSRDYSFNKILEAIEKETLAKTTIYVTEDQDNENLLWLLGSRSFKKAVGECFTKEKNQQKFIKFVKRRVSVGRIMGFALMFAAYGKAISVLGRFAPKVTSFINNASLASIVGLSAFEIYEKISHKRYIKKQCGEPATLECISKIINGLPNNHPDKVELKQSIEE